MKAIDVLADLSRRGFSVLVDGDLLGVEPSSRLDDQLRTLIREHKADMIRAIAGCDHDHGRHRTPNVKANATVKRASEYPCPTCADSDWIVMPSFGNELAGYGCRRCLAEWASQRPEDAAAIALSASVIAGLSSRLLTAGWFGALASTQPEPEV
jgi:hypothetical protein